MSDKEERMMELHKELDKMKEVRTPIEIINRNSGSINEKEAKKFLFYFLDPHGNHGLDSELLDHMLDSISKYTDFAHRYSLSELNNCMYESEVKTVHGKQADGLMWLERDFFICWEVKVDGDEESYDDLDLHQTEVYAEEADKFWKKIGIVAEV